MSLEDEIQRAAREIATDGYEMSIGELMSLYRDQELVVNPEFQRYFRWKIIQKSRFIESILLGIPVPAVFVFQTEDGTWELVDGLQRLSTIFEFAGILRLDDGYYEPSTLAGTKLLPSLEGKKWESAPVDGTNALTRSQQLQIRRARMRVEILRKESDAQSKYELFQRLNTGGSALSQQEVRNVIMLMINRKFYTWVSNLSRYEPFVATVVQTDEAEKRQKDVELVVRFVVLRNVPYQSGSDVHEYLDDSVVQLATQEDFDYTGEGEVFESTFRLLDRAMGVDAFKRYSDDGRFLGQFLMSSFEAVAVGISKNIRSILELGEEEQHALVRSKIQELWDNPKFKQNSGAGVRGTTRLANLIPLGEEFFRP